MLTWIMDSVDYSVAFLTLSRFDKIKSILSLDLPRLVMLAPLLTELAYIDFFPPSCFLLFLATMWH